jgi:hypothetical protein
MSNKFVYQDGDVQTIKNSGLVCNGCALVYKGNTLECACFRQKPVRVLRGETCAERVPLKGDALD